MPNSWIPDMNKYISVIDFSLKENADNCVQAGQKLIGTRTALIGKNAAIFEYRVGWLHGAGEPICPPVIDEISPHDTGPFEN